jgi:energy-coupling factor transport system substrate-specific component
VSWPLASFAIIGVVLALGWLAYERRRPSARMVAVVGTLAAVAALGRDAFVALPDVKPITAITLVVGYALGPLPGFTVGAVGMLMSNFLLGQGPYTPWQMAAWGGVGLFGAALGRLGGRHMGRVPLALCCGIAALAAKEVMNVYTFTIGATHTAGAFLVVAGAGLPFDLTDMVASFLFGLAFGPELARLLARMRARMDIQWDPASPTPVVPRAPASGAATSVLAILALVTVGSVFAFGGAFARASIASTARAQSASLSPELSFLASAQNSNGGFGAAKGQSSSELYTAWTAMGLAAVGRNPATVRRDGHSVLDALRAEVSSLSGLGDAERTILAAAACGASSYSFAGRDLVAEVLSAREADSSFEQLVNLTSFAIFALRAVGHSQSFPAIRDAAGWIEQQQNSDGGFGFGEHGSPSDVDDTGAALQALAAAGARNAHDFAAAADFLIRSQNLDGGFPQQYGSESNAQSTAWAIQGLIAATDRGSASNPNTLRRRGSRTPDGYLESLLAPGGSIRYSRTGAQTPVWVTAQALIALSGKTFPVGP